MSLDDDDGKSFDQFAGKKSTYKDELYTTKIDESKVTDETKKKAELIEKEILGQDSRGNIHLAEERNQVNQKDEDETERYEEMKYSGVYRQNE